MKRGVTLIELVVVVAMVAIILSVGSLSISKVRGKRMVEESKSKIVEVLEIYTDKAFHEGEEYKVEFDYTKKEIRVKDQSESLIEVENLPTMLEYTTVYDGSKLTEVSTETDNKGGLTNSFSIYIFDVNNKARYRISIDSISNPSGMAYINIYRNKSSGITFDNVQDEHYEFNSNQWTKE